MDVLFADPLDMNTCTSISNHLLYDAWWERSVCMSFQRVQVLFCRPTFKLDVLSNPLGVNNTSSAWYNLLSSVKWDVMSINIQKVPEDVLSVDPHQSRSNGVSFRMWKPTIVVQSMNTRSHYSYVKSYSLQVLYIALTTRDCIVINDWCRCCDC